MQKDLMLKLREWQWFLERWWMVVGTRSQRNTVPVCMLYFLLLTTFTRTAYSYRFVYLESWKSQTKAYSHVTSLGDMVISIKVRKFGTCFYLDSTSDIRELG